MAGEKNGLCYPVIVKNRINADVLLLF